MVPGPGCRGCPQRLESEERVKYLVWALQRVVDREESYRLHKVSRYIIFPELYPWRGTGSAEERP